MLVASLLALHAALAWLGRMPGVLTGEDEAIYLLLARQLGELGYSDVFLSHQPVHAMYPPGYPAALALWGLVVGDAFDGFLLIGIACSVAALLLTFVAVRRLWSEAVAFAVLAPLAVNPYLVDRAGTLASEAPYMMLTILALWGAVRGGQRSLAIAGIAAVAAALTRSIGMTVVAALAANWVSGRQFAVVPGRRFAVAGALGAAAVLTIGAWLAWSFAAPGKLVGASYAADFTRAGVGGGPGFLAFLAVVGKRIVTNVPSYLVFTIPTIMPMPAVASNPVDNVLGAALTVGGLAAGGMVLWRRWRTAALYLIATMAVLAVWPWHIERFAMPLLPLLVTGLVLGVGELVGRRWPGRRTAAMAAVAGLLFVTGAVQVTSDLSAAARCQRGHSPPAPSCVTSDQTSFFAALEYVRSELPPDAILLTAKRATAYYYTGRRQIQWQAAAAVGPDRMIGFLREQGVGYVLLGSLHWADLDQLPNALEPNCAALELVRAFPPRTYLLRVRQPGEPDDGSGCRALSEHRAKNVGRDFDQDR